MQERVQLLQKALPESSATRIGLALQLVLSHLVAGGVALTAFLLLEKSGLGQPATPLIACVLGGIVGWLLTIPLQYNLYIVELTLLRLARGLSVEHLSTVWRWPIAGFFAALNALSERIGFYEQQAALTGELRDQALRQAAEVAAQEERNRIARDLHDSVKQQIFSISMSAAAAKAHWRNSSEDARAAVEDIQLSVKEAQIEMQALLQQLRSSPLENTNLAEALRTQAQALGYRSGVQVHIEIEELPACDRLLPATSEQIFRLVQEAFANIARHARATTVWLRLYQRDNALHIAVRDDGKGFDPLSVKKGMGLANLQERAKSLGGRAEISSLPGKGTTIHVTVPLLDTLSIAQEREQAQRETATAVERAKWGLQLGENVEQLAFVLMIIMFVTRGLLTLPLIGLGICLLVVLYGCIYGHYYTTRVVINSGSNNSETIFLLRRVHLLWLNLLRVTGIVIWYIFFLLQGWQQTEAWIIAFLLTGLVAALLIYEHRRYYLLLNRHYTLLPANDLRWEIELNWRNLRRRFARLTIFLVVLSTLFFFKFVNFAFPPNASAGWAVYGTVAFGIFWSLTMLVDYLQLRNWKRHVLIAVS